MNRRGTRDIRGSDDRRVRAGLRALAADAPARSAAAAGALGDEAARRGLLDVAVGFVESPVGRLLVAVTPLGVVRVAFPERAEEALEELAGRVSPRVLESPAAVDPVRRELEEYFDGRLRRFRARVDLRLATGFRRRVLEATARIPFGEVATYAQVAARAGNPRAARAAGGALGANPVPIVVPCHRVVGAGGALTGYAGGTDRKAALLRLEGALPGSAGPDGG